MHLNDPPSSYPSFPSSTITLLLDRSLSESEEAPFEPRGVGEWRRDKPEVPQVRPGTSPTHPHPKWSPTPYPFASSLVLGSGILGTRVPQLRSSRWIPIGVPILPCGFWGPTQPSVCQSTRRIAQGPSGARRTGPRRPRATNTKMTSPIDYVLGPDDPHVRRLLWGCVGPPVVADDCP